MTGPPAARPVPQEACGVPRSSSKPPKWVLLVNQVRNDYHRGADNKPRMKRHDADVLVKNGRAAWVSWANMLADDGSVKYKYGVQLSLTAHEVNKREAAEAAAGYKWPVGKVATVRELLGKDGTCPVRADNQCRPSHEPGQLIGHPRANREFRECNEM